MTLGSLPGEKFEYLARRIYREQVRSKVESGGGRAGAGMEQPEQKKQSNSTAATKNEVNSQSPLWSYSLVLSDYAVERASEHACVSRSQQQRRKIALHIQYFSDPNWQLSSWLAVKSSELLLILRVAQSKEF